MYNGDASDFLGALPSESADLIFLDPPFNLGKRYSDKAPHLDRRSESEYLRWMSSILLACVRVLTKGGALYLYHLPNWNLRLGADLERHLEFRHWIAVSMKNGFVRGKRLYPAHYSLLYFTKGPPRNFERPKVSPATCRHCGKNVKDYGGYTHIIEKKGLNLSDVWEDVSPVRHGANKNRKANELPRTITDRVVQISGVVDGLFVDPFAGAGAGMLSAARFGMRFKGTDLVRENCDVIVRRMDDFKRESRSGGGA